MASIFSRVWESHGWKDGVREGLWTWYYKGGNIRAQGSFKANWLDGWYREYNKQSQPTFEKYYKDGFEEDPPEEPEEPEEEPDSAEPSD